MNNPLLEKKKVSNATSCVLQYYKLEKSSGISQQPKIKKGYSTSALLLTTLECTEEQGELPEGNSRQNSVAFENEQVTPKITTGVHDPSRYYPGWDQLHNLWQPKPPLSI
jgi:hypothetical protein